MKLIKKLIIGISTLGLLVMTLVSATYAWFEINERATVENFRFEVHGGSGFLVSIDNVNWSNDLKIDQLQKAMLVGLDSSKFEIADDGTETLYYINPDGTKVDHTDRVAEHVASFIKLLPTTSLDGRSLVDNYGSPSNSSLGRFIQFNVYFRASSRLESDNFTYNIYLNDKEAKLDNDIVLEPTTITSIRTDVGLAADMKAMVYDETTGEKVPTSLLRSENASIPVYSSNALRLSITENDYYEELGTDLEGNPIVTNSGYKLAEYADPNEKPTKIFEINDTVNGKYDLGSYATNYSGAEDTEDYILYNSEYNAMYTYYNNLKPTAKLTSKLLSYDTVKNMGVIRDLSTHKTIVTVKSGGPAKLVTFRIWLEGWDADCFDGLKESIQMKLTFGSTLVSD